MTSFAQRAVGIHPEQERRTKTEQQIAAHTVSDEAPTNKCRFCGEAIPATAKKCKYCGEWLTKKASRPSKDAICDALAFEKFQVIEKTDSLIRAVSPTGMFGVATMIFFTGLFLAGRVSVRITPNSSNSWNVKVGLTPVSHLILLGIILVSGPFTLGLGWIMFPLYPFVKNDILREPRKVIQTIVENAQRHLATVSEYEGE